MTSSLYLRFRFPLTQHFLTFLSLNSFQSLVDWYTTCSLELSITTGLPKASLMPYKYHG